MKQNPCPRCGDRGVIIREDKTAVICPCARSSRVNNLLKSSHMTGFLSKKNFHNFELGYYSKTKRYNDRTHHEIATRALETCKSFVRDCLDGKNPRGLYLFGQVGSGKTHLACSVANGLIKGGVEVVFLVVPDYLEEIKHSWDHGNSYNEKEVLDRAREVSVLVLDDLGAHSYSEWTKSKIYAILNYRINNCLSTVITSNLEYHEIENYLDHRISSRLTELCKPVILLVDRDEDIRLQMLLESVQKPAWGKNSGA